MTITFVVHCLPLFNNGFVNLWVMHPLANPKLSFRFGEILLEEQQRISLITRGTATEMKPFATSFFRLLDAMPKNQIIGGIF